MAEFAITAGIVLASIAASGSLLHAEWSRFRCARNVFEAVHSARIGARSAMSATSARLTESPTEIHGELDCGRGVTESATLPRLEATR